jgi:3-phenylpropionate/trans-cinnamate dioxygenase ferredoxin component
MNKWLDTISVDKLRIGQKQAIDLEDRALLLVRLSDGIYAIDNRCTHADAELTDGDIENNEIICPWHGARFCIKTGAVTYPPAFDDLTTYPVRIHEDMIQVQVEE